MNSLRAFLFLLIFGFTLSGCKKEDPNPELKDPIFSDLSKRAKDFEAEYTSLSTEVAELRKKLASAPEHSMERKDYLSKISRNLPKLRHSDQMRVYYKIRADRRKLEARIAYKKAFQAEKEWPDPKEFEDYKTAKSVREINPNWNARVPKLHERKPAGKKTGSSGAEKKAH